MKYRDILFEQRDGIARITINRPERRNAVSLGTIDEIRHAIGHVQADAHTRVLVFTGAGGSFSSGADLKAFPESISPDYAFSMTASYLNYYQAIRELDIPVIARINGDAFGGGAGAALACDIRIATEAARFSWPFVKIGVSGADAGATYFLPRLVGYGRAAELLMTGRVLSAREALEIGIVHEVVPHDDLDERVDRLALEFAAGPPLALAYTKRALRTSMDKDLRAELDYEQLASIDCLLGDEFAEGVRAFKERRRPNFPPRRTLA